MQTQLVRDLGGVHGIRQILLVRKDQQQRVPQLVLVEHALQFLTSLDHTIAVIGVDDEDDALGVLEVVAPEGADLVLPAYIPNGELDVLVFDCLDVESCSTRVSRCTVILLRLLC